eukprot:CAMPEP_0119562572 /NCGR_PEP_ID=MMETSP1352-20130426/20876_1 /TAXON_ID=265584 /ORGANISM="Stauroneis constricta, Strain CCMP1120" /LENGTH=67 /DNA_ID=CAMNT_0007611009 /DNA_START=69 /DNA_END=268 /DNA_ORIENTATION=-
MIPEPTVEVLLNDVLMHSQYRHDGLLYANDPESKVAYPVFDDFGENGNFIGVLSSSLYWRSYFIDIL